MAEEAKPKKKKKLRKYKLLVGSHYEKGLRHSAADGTNIVESDRDLEKAFGGAKFRRYTPEDERADLARLSGEDPDADDDDEDEEDTDLKGEVEVAGDHPGGNPLVDVTDKFEEAREIDCKVLKDTRLSGTKVYSVVRADDPELTPLNDHPLQNNQVVKFIEKLAAAD